MMFEVLTKHHPYINQRGIKTQKDFVSILRHANMFKPKLYGTYSLQLQELFDIVARMCSKTIKNRITCKELYDYLDTNEVFTPFR